MGLLAFAVLAAATFGAPAFAASGSISTSAAATIGGSVGNSSSASFANDTGIAIAGDLPGGGSGSFSSNTAVGADVTHGDALGGYTSTGFSAAGNFNPF